MLNNSNVVGASDLCNAIEEFLVLVVIFKESNMALILRLGDDF